MRVQLREFCAARAGDKSDISDVSVFACSADLFEVVREQVTTDVVAAHLAPLRVGAVERFELPKLLALKFVIHDALGGGAASSLRADNLGKTFGGTMLRIEVDVPEGLVTQVPRPRPVSDRGSPQ